MYNQSITRTLVAALFATSLSACASVSPAALARLASLDPLSADPAQISVAARLPQSLKLRTGDLVMLVKTDATEGPDKIDETFYLEVKDAAPGDAGVINPETNERLQTAQVAPQDIERLRATQAKARALKAAGDGKGKGSLTVSATGGCRTAELKDQALVMNLFMQTETNGEWFPVVNSLNLWRALGEDVLAKIPPC